MYKVYFNQNTIIFATSSSACQGAVIADPDAATMKALIGDCYDKGKAKITFFSPTGQDLRKIFDPLFRHIEAAGGIVRHTVTGKILVIRRWGRWDLPKGWKEPGETDEQNALREVTEETGLIGLEIEGFVGTSRHAYVLDGQWAIKHTRWYAMRTEAAATVPQSEEGIGEAVWLTQGQLADVLRETYPNIREILETYLEKYPLPR